MKLLIILIIYPVSVLCYLSTRELQVNVAHLTENFFANLHEHPYIKNALLNESKIFIDKQVENYMELIKQSHGLLKHSLTRRSLPIDDITTLTKDNLGTYVLDGVVPMFNMKLQFPKDIRFIQDGNEEWYAAVLESKDKTTGDDLVVYKFINEAFIEINRIVVKNGVKLGTISLDEGICIIVAENNTISESVHEKTRVFQLIPNTGLLRNIQFLDAEYASDVALWKEHTKIFMAVATYMKNENNNYEAKIPIYQWFGRHFDKIDSIKTYGVRKITPFIIGNSHFLAVANFQNNFGNINIYSEIFKYDRHLEKFETYQKIQTKAAVDVKYFQLKAETGAEHFLIFANSFDRDLNGTNIYETDSIVYKHVEGYFIPFQSFKLNGVLEWLPVVGLNGQFALLAACKFDGIKIFQYDGWKFVESEVQYTDESFSKGVLSMQTYQFNGKTIVVIANQNDHGNMANVFELKFTNKKMLSKFHDDNLQWCQKNLHNYKSQEPSMTSVSKRSIKTNVDSNNIKSQNFIKKEELSKLKKELQQYEDELTQLEIQIQLLLNNTQDNIIEGNIYVRDLTLQNDDAYIESLTTNSINSENISNILENIIDINNDFSAENLFEFVNATMDASIQPKYLNGHLMDDVIYKNNDQHLHELLINGDAIFQNGIFIDGRLNGINFTKDNILLREGNQSLSNLGLNILSAELLDADFINDIDMSQIESFKNQPKIVENINTLNVKTAHITGLINNVDIPTLKQFALKTFGTQTVTSKYRFDSLYVDNLNVKTLSGKSIPEELILIHGGDYTLEQAVEFTNELSANTIFLKENLNNIDIINEELDVLVTDDSKLQHITGYKEFENIELSSPIKLLGQINNSKVDRMNPVKTIDREIIIHGDCIINGEVNIEQLLQASDLQSTEPGFSVTHLQWQGIKLNEEKIPTHLNFKQPLNVQEVFTDTINNVLVDSLVVMGTNEEQIISGWKTFLGDVFVTGSTRLENVNGINLPSLESGVLKISGDQTLSGNHHFETVIANRVYNVKTTFGEHLWEDIVKVNEDQHISGTIVISDSIEIDRLEAESIFCNSLVNDYNFTSMIEDSVFRNQTITLNGHTHFGDVAIDNLQVDKLDLNLLPKIIGDSKVIFEFDEDIELLEPINVESIHFTDHFNGIPYQDFGNKWLSNVDEQVINSDQTFDKITIYGNLYVASGFLNNVNITDLTYNSVKIDEPFHFQTATFSHGLSSLADIILDGQFESLDLNDIVQSHTKDTQVIVDQVIFNGDLTVNGEIFFNGLISGFNLTQLCEFSYDDKNGPPKNLHIAGNAYFAKGPEINSVNHLSIKHILDSAWFKNQDSSISGVMEFGNVNFQEDLTVQGFVDDVKVQLIAQTYFSKTKDQNITAVYNFDDNVIFSRGVHAPKANVKGTVGGINLAEFINTALLNNYEQIFENMVYLESCEIQQLHGEYLVNDLNLQNDVMRYDQNNIVTGKKTVRDIETYVLKIDRNVYVQNVNLLPWMLNSVLKVGTFQLKGLMTFSNHTTFTKGIRSQQTVNGLQFNDDTVMLRSKPQTILAPKYFFTSESSLKFNDLHLKGFINGIDMTELIQQQAYKNRDVVFQTPIYFNGSITTPNVYVEKFYQGVNVSQLINNITHFASVRNYTENFDKLLDVSYQVRDSLQGHAYFINYYKVKQIYQMIDVIIPVSFHKSGVQHLGCVVKSNHRYVTKFEVWDSNAEFFHRDTEIPTITTDTNLGYIKEIKFRGKDHWYIEHDRTTPLSTQNKYEGSIFEITRKGFKQIVPAILHNGTQYVTSLELPLINKCMLMLFSTHAGIFCETLGESGGKYWDTYQVIEISNSIGGTVDIVNNVTYIFIMNGGTLDKPSHVDIWKFNDTTKYFSREQAIYMSYPTSISTVRYKNCNFLAIASGYQQNPKYEGMITIRKYDEDRQYFIKWQDIPLNVPIQVLFAELPTQELILYVSTNNPTEPLIMYQYEGISHFVKNIVARTIPHSSQLKSFNTPDFRHFLLAKHGNETSVIEAVFKGQKNN